jgi:hypothetical protein
VDGKGVERKPAARPKKMAARNMAAAAKSPKKRVAARWVPRKRAAAKVRKKSAAKNKKNK